MGVLLYFVSYIYFLFFILGTLEYSFLFWYLKMYVEFVFCFRLFVLLIISLTDVYRVYWLPFGVFFVLAKPLKHFELVVCLKGTIEEF